MAGILGLFFILILSATPMVELGGVSQFFNLASLIPVMGITIGLGLLSFGFDRYVEGFLAAMTLPFQNEDPSKEQVKLIPVLRGIRGHFYYAALITITIGLIHLATTAPQAASLSDLGPGVGTNLLAIFYAIILDQVFARPALHRLEVIE
ncbi:MAG: hypothetical protein HQL52_18725 [Magnetococcales bacterium]|nr:hypothetical protein [Magnetococcales bacterium]